MRNLIQFAACPLLVVAVASTASADTFFSNPTYTVNTPLKHVAFVEMNDTGGIMSPLMFGTPEWMWSITVIGNDIEVEGWHRVAPHGEPGPLPFHIGTITMLNVTPGAAGPWAAQTVTSPHHPSGPEDYMQVSVLAGPLPSGNNGPLIRIQMGHPDIPAPGAIALFGLGGIAASRRRR